METDKSDDRNNTYASFPSPWEDTRSPSTEGLIRNSQPPTAEDCATMLSPTHDLDACTKEQLDRKAAEMLKSRVDIEDDVTFKRRSSAPNAGRFAPAQRGIRILIGNDETGRKNIRSVDPDEAELSAEGTGRRVAYEDFTTIDWIHDLAKERVRQRHLLDAARYSWRGRARQLFDATQAWLVVLAVGVSVGILAGVIDVSSEWLSDLKDGHCTTAFYLNRNFCCWMIDDQDDCTEWVTWSGALSVTNPVGSWLIEYLFYVMFATCFAGTSAVLVRTYAPYAAGSGIPEVKTILGGFVIRKFLGVWTLIIKSVGLVLSTAANMSLGKEGPLVHVACCCGNIFPRLFRKFKYNEAKKREILSAASAAGVSVAFGAPIGGVLFSLEEVSYYFPYKTMWRSFFCAMIAAVSLQVMNPFRTGKLVLFQVQYDRDWHGFELIFFVILGIFGGLYGSFFIKFNTKLAAFRKRSWLRNFPVEEVLVIAAFTGLVSYTNIFLRVGTVELVANLFKECENGDFHGLCKADSFNGIVTLLLISAVVKIGLTICTFGVRVPAGIFMPSMAVGACVGRAMGMAVQAWQSAHKDFWLFGQCKPDVQCITPGTYAMVGAAATLGGVTRMTVSLVVIMFELTGALTYVLPIMIAVMTAKWVGDAFGKETIYDALCRLNGYPLLDSKEEYTHNVVASQVMTTVDDLVVIPSSGLTLDSLDEFLHDTDFKGFPVVSNQRDLILVGFINRTELRYAIHRGRHEQGKTGFSPCYFTSLPILEDENFVDLRPWTDQTPITVADIYPMDMVIDLFRKMGLRYVIVTNHGQLAGLITKKDVLRHINLMKHPETDVNHLRQIERRRFPSAGALGRAIG